MTTAINYSLVNQMLKCYPTLDLEFLPFEISLSWKGNQEASIDLKSFLEKWLPGMEKDNLLVAVFPTPAGKSAYVQPAVLQESIEEELKQYELAL